MTIARMTGVQDKKDIVEEVIQNVRKNRCRSLSEEDVVELLDEVSEEMVGGRNMFKFLIEETIADADRSPAKWEDLK